MRKIAVASLLGLGLLGAILSGKLDAAPPKAPAKPARPVRPDILLITIDTLRADALGFSGNKASQTPLLDRLAQGGRVYVNAHAHNVVTLPSHTNLLTGLYPYQHGVRDNSGFTVKPTLPTLATVLRGAGYATGAFVSSFPLDSQYGLDRGFDVYDDHYPEGTGAEEFVLPERRGDETVKLAAAWWAKQKGKPRFLWVHLFDPHAPYAPPEPFASRFKGRPYLGEVAAVDSYLSPLLSPLLGGKEPPALVAVTSDHGEALGDHGELTHGLFAYESTLKVPLVLWGHRVPPGRDGRLARHVDVFPTLLAAAGVVAPAGGPPRPGRSLLAPVVGTAPPDSYFEALSAALNRGWAPLRGLLEADRKYIALPLPEVYHLATDPLEAKNLIDQDRRDARAAFARLPAESTWPPPRSVLSEKEEARLRSLGYISGNAAAKASYGPEDDPKTLLPLDRKIHTIIDRYHRGRFAESIQLAREVVAARPSMPLGHSLLAQGLLETGDLDEALKVMRSARAQGVASDTLLRQLGLTLAETGRVGEAIEVLQPLAEISGDPRSNNAYALALSEAGKQQEAITVLQKVLAGDADNPSSYEQLSLAYLRLGRFGEARDAAQKALSFNPELSRAWNNLGVALFQLKQTGGALDAWQKATDLDPRLFDALWNLGIKAAEAGRTAQAKKALEKFVATAPKARYKNDIDRARALLAQLGG